MRYYFIAGEASGDLHGSNLIKELKKLDHSATIRCWGGDLMQQAGGELVKHYRDLAFMGFIEVIRNLGTIMANLRFCKEDILQFKPDTLVLIDYPGFNLRIAEWAKTQGIKVVFYISPQVWAWKENRVKKMKKTIDEMLVILPFEKDYYKNKWNWEVDYVGHPLIEVVESYQHGNTQRFQTHHCRITRQPQTGDPEKTAHHARSLSQFSRPSLCCSQSTRTGRQFL
jgi:lipid-A-disaccharide synthase